MAIEVITKDCSALSDAEFAEMAEVTTTGPSLETGLLSKQADEWVLNSQARRGGTLEGFVYSSLERIGGTPALVIGLATVSIGASATLRALMHDQFHKARMAFPDEDVVVCARMDSPAAMHAFVDLEDVRPQPATRLNGEQRAWGRRLAARYRTVSFDDKSMHAVGDSQRLVFDYRPSDGAEQQENEDFQEIFSCCADEASFVIVWGWAMAEFLDRFQLPAS